MTIAIHSTIDRYYGVKADTKPTGVKVGSRFTETDTKDVFITYDGTNWTKLLRNSESDQTSDWKR